MRAETPGNGFAVSRQESSCVRIENKFCLRLRRSESLQSFSRSLAQPQRDVSTSTVMNDDRGVAGEHIVRVKGVDREVVGENRRGVVTKGEDLGGMARDGLKPVTDVKLVCSGPCVGGGVPVWVVGGSSDRLRAT